MFIIRFSNKVISGDHREIGFSWEDATWKPHYNTLSSEDFKIKLKKWKHKQASLPSDLERQCFKKLD